MEIIEPHEDFLYLGLILKPEGLKDLEILRRFAPQDFGVGKHSDPSKGSRG